MELREEIAALLLDRDEYGDGSNIEWGRTFIRTGKDAIHSGDCTKESHACHRCCTDRVLADADKILALVRTNG